MASGSKSVLSRIQNRHERIRSRLLDQHFADQLEGMKNITLQASIDDNTEQLKSIFGASHDLVYRNFHLETPDNRHALLVYIDGLVKAEIIDEIVLKPAMLRPFLPDAEEAEEGPLYAMQKSGLPVHETAYVELLGDAVHAILCGDGALFIDGDPHALILNIRGWGMRSIQEPATESVVRGPREGFTETLRTNTALIRRRLKDPLLRVEQLQVGKRSRTDVAVLYIDGLTNPAIVKEVLRRIRTINIDAILESGYIEQLIQDNGWTPFPLMQNTERPDKAVSHLLEGKVIIISDGTPFVLIAPAVFTQLYHSPEDYYERFSIGTLIRLIRMISMVMALLLPSLYIAFSSFHPEMIPSRLVIAMAAGRSTVPFPSIVEAFLMEVTMEILREASVRLPGPIGPTIGIVGALVVGQAAVQAGIVSPIMVIVVALTTIGSFASPSYSAAIALRMLRFPIMIVAALFGLYGIMLFLIIIIIHLCWLKSFGIPYLSPLTPSRLSDLKDTLIRTPLNWMRMRPVMFVPKDRERYQKPQPESQEEEGEEDERISRNEPDAVG